MAFDFGSLLGAASVASPVGGGALAAGALGGAAQPQPGSSAANTTTVNATQGAESRVQVGRIGGEFSTSFGSGSASAGSLGNIPTWAWIAAAAAGLLLLWRRR